MLLVFMSRKKLQLTLIGDQDERDRNSIKEATRIQIQPSAHHSMKGQTAGYISTLRNATLFGAPNSNAKLYKSRLNLLREANKF